MTSWMVPSVKRLISPSWVLISFVARHLMPFWLRLIICERLLPNQLSAVTFSLALTGGSSMPRDLLVHNNLSTIFVHLNDRITPTQLRFNMSQLACNNFRLDWITPYQRLIWGHRSFLLPDIFISDFLPLAATRFLDSDSLLSLEQNRCHLEPNRTVESHSG